MAISDYILGPRFINEGIPSVYRPANVSPFFRMDATSGATPKLGLEPLYPNFGAPMPMDYNSVTLGDGQYLLQPDVNTNVPMLAPLDMNRFQGVSDMSIIDETTNDEQDQEYIDQVNQSNNKFGGIMDLIGSLVIPGYGFFKGIAKGGLEGLKGFGRRLGQSDFAQSDTHMEFLKRRRDREALARDPNIFQDARDITARLERDGSKYDRPDRNISSVTTSSAAKSRGVGGGGYTKSDSNREKGRGVF